MKKLSRYSRDLKVRRAHFDRRREARVSGVLRNRTHYRNVRIGVARKPWAFQAPKVFDLRFKDTRKSLLLFLAQIENSLAAGQRVKLCFANTDALRPCGTLYFVSNLEALVAKYPGMIDCQYPKDDVVEQLFQHIGFLERFGLAPRKQVTAENVVNWDFATGTDATTNAFQALLMRHQEAMGGEIIRSELYDCMSEAVTNTRKHAYPESRGEGLSRWWMFSQASDETLTVAICDLGVGVPQSLLNKPELADFLRRARYTFSPQKLHSKLIEVAVSSNRSSTGLAYRGKGLPQMLDFIKSGKTGGFRVQSGHGIYSYSAEEQMASVRARKQPIKGTLVQWTLSLKN